jgi:hypothetical protein
MDDIPEYEKANDDMTTEVRTYQDPGSGNFVFLWPGSPKWAAAKVPHVGCSRLHPEDPGFQGLALLKQQQRKK